MVRDTLPDKIGISVSYPLPGTRFYEMVRAQLGDKTHWEDSSDLAMMFQGTYQSPFYRHLHKLLHHDLELRQRLASGVHDASLLDAMDQLNADWLELGYLETQQRSPLPTALVHANINTHSVIADM
jgi:anaerobic magnesium-protoporphyrin IX monomethyl ester cyclase